MIEFAQLPAPPDLEELRRRGAAIVAVLSDRAFVLAASDTFTSDGLDLTWSGAFAPAEKLSPRLRRGRSSYYIAEFHPDVDMRDARAIALECGLRLVDNPDLLPNDLLLQGSAEALAELAQWDEVAYIYTASSELARGIRVNGCAGALTNQGPVSAGVPLIGDGWDGPGHNGADLKYAFLSLTGKLPADAAKSEIVRAFSEWARYAKLTFSESAQTPASRTLTVSFMSGAHGDAYPFTGALSIAHTFYPYPVNPEPIAGDMHLNDAVMWRIGAETDLFTVALHEAGHALGLGHSDNPADVMYPYYRRAGGLSLGDVAAILQLYAPQTSDPADPSLAPFAIACQNLPSGIVNTPAVALNGTITGGSGNVLVSWRSGISSGIATGSRPWSAVIPVAVGANSVTLTAVDAQQHVATSTVTIVRAQPGPATTIQIQQPSLAGAYTTSSSTVVISGSASDPSGIDHVSWMNSRGGAGIATGAASWSTGPVPLAAGQNGITITAYGKTGASAAQSIVVSYAATPAMPSVDTTAPSLTIVSPANAMIQTSAASIVVTGTASDNTGVTSVTWSSSTAGSGACLGTTTWKTPAIPLLIGTNVITIRAADAAGNVAWRTAMVTRSGQ